VRQAFVRRGTGVENAERVNATSLNFSGVTPTTVITTMKAGITKSGPITPYLSFPVVPQSERSLPSSW
jgi:hypothetical protein